ncbi:MAG: Crp/Fnr family transcriptional regulator, partial [Beijerinckiaceae bacterium]
MQSIARIAFFRDATDIDLSRFDRRCVWKTVEAGRTVVDFEDLSSDVHFLVSGEVRIQIRTP